MRLFYIIIFLSMLFCAVSVVSHAKNYNAQKEKSKISFFSDKKQFKLCAESGLENESFERDLINNIIQKIPIAFLLFFSLQQLFFKHGVSNEKLVIKTLKRNYWCLLKMLYPKHVFW